MDEKQCFEVAENKRRTGRLMANATTVAMVKETTGRQHCVCPCRPQTPVNENGESTSSMSIMTRPGATACRFSTCNRLDAKTRAAAEQGWRAHLEDVKAAAGQQQNFLLCEDRAREQAAAVKRSGGRRPAEMLLRALMSTPLETRMRKMVRSPCAAAEVRGK